MVEKQTIEIWFIQVDGSILFSKKKKKNKTKLCLIICT